MAISILLRDDRHSLATRETLLIQFEKVFTFIILRLT